MTVPNKLTQPPRYPIQLVIKIKCSINPRSLRQSSDNKGGCDWMIRPTVSKPISGRVHDPVRVRDAGRGWRHPIFGRGFKKSVPDDEETAKCRSGRIMEPPLEMVIRRVCPCAPTLRLHPSSGRRVFYLRTIYCRSFQNIYSYSFYFTRLFQYQWRNVGK